MFTLLQAARFFAAFLVVAHHGSGLFAQPDYFSFIVLGKLLQAGDMGVDFFFVLSGFIILYAHWNDIGQPNRLLPFLRKRALRIYPAYLVVFVCVLPIVLMVDTKFSAEAHDPLYLLQNMFLLPMQGNMIPVNWTLRHEVLFYALFAVMIWRLHIGLVVFAVWFLASAVISGPLEPDEFVLTGAHHIEFLAGMAAAYLTRTTVIPAPRLLTAAGLAGFAMCLYLSGHVYVEQMLTNGPNLATPLALSSFLIIVGLVEIERSGKVTAPAALRYLGDASYSLYLTHFTVLTAYAKLVRRLGVQDPALLLLLLVVGIVITVVIGCAFYSLVERPMTRALRRFRREAVTGSTAPQVV